MERYPSGSLNQNGLFANAIKEFDAGKRAEREQVKVYEKLKKNCWSEKGFFELVDYKVVHDGKRKVFHFLLKKIKP